MSAKTIDLTPDVLRVLGHGILDLRKGDLRDRAQADRIEEALKTQGFEYGYGNFAPIESATLLEIFRKDKG